MTSQWLKLALDAVSEETTPCANSVISADRRPFGTKDTNGTPPPIFQRQPGPTRIDAADIEERTAIAEHDAGVPAAYAGAFAALQQSCPAGVSLPRWRQFTDDAGRFLDSWGVQAFRLNWSVQDLFGLAGVAPGGRYARTGLLWLLSGQPVRLLDASSATLASGLYWRRPSR